MSPRNASTDPPEVAPPPLPPAVEAYTGLVPRAAEMAIEGYKRYLEDFLLITRRAREKFETRDWRGRNRDAYYRLDLYEKHLEIAAQELEELLGDVARLEPAWARIKAEFERRIADRDDAELFETFFNSITRKILGTVGLNRAVEFFHLGDPYHSPDGDAGLYRTYRLNSDTARVCADILREREFTVPFERLERDAELIAHEMDLRLWPFHRRDAPIVIDVIHQPFFRNKVAYIIGRIRAGARTLPLVIPLLNGKLGIAADAVLLDEGEASIVFSFAYSYFHVETDRYRELIAFLQTILPQKPRAELFNSIGFNHHGKTIYYRDLHHYVHVAKERFIIAPGKEGAVMIAFTMPHYTYVLKVIKDYPCFLRTPVNTSKSMTRQSVRHQYAFVIHHDRVGRMVDTQEFENLRFKTSRFSADLLEEFRVAARGSVSVGDEYVIVRHLYVQRRVIPLPMFFQSETDPESIRRVLIDFGYFLKDLAASGIFPSDLFNIWNYGVTSHGRVVLYDYDDILPLDRVRFRTKPVPTADYEEMLAEEDWVVATPDDFFIDEMDLYSGIPEPLKGVFKAYPGDLYTLEFWNSIKRRHARGEIIDITAYDRSKRFRNKSRWE